MKKQFLIPQPPLTDKLTFLVDDINESHTLGLTTDFDKIEYNLKLIDESFRQDLEIGLNFSETGIMDVLDIGRYIAVIGIKKYQSTGKIYFFDTTVNFSRKELSEMLKADFKFSAGIIERFMVIYDLMKSESSPSFDNVELLRPLES
ncbi:hypothetical protein [Gaetbulibacter sp. PBL-D1]|uniref:hypothetical protein n=1 Tax=Gaetbulibacter sp. PBL-D1 TaxID=3422594 RepID=UPI003D2EBA8A